MRRGFFSGSDRVEGGVLLVDKPVDWTSHDVVSFIRGFGFRKVGHCGTLDPGATGLLVLLIEKATKLAGYFSNQNKGYEGEMHLGIETSTQDAGGDIVVQKDLSGITDSLIHEAFAKFTGPQEQIPPMVSAKKIGGKPLYKLARKGIVVPRKPIPVTIYELSVKQIRLPTISLSVTCSKGTYVRTLCCDIGKDLGCGAHLKSLRRIVSGYFNVADAFPISEIRTWNRTKVLENCKPVEPLQSYREEDTR